MIIKSLTINTQVGGKINCPGQLAPTTATKHMNQTTRYTAQFDLRVGGGGGKINRPGQLGPRLCNQAYVTERQGIQLNFTCIITVIDATSYSDSLKELK